MNRAGESIASRGDGVWRLTWEIDNGEMIHARAGEIGRLRHVVYSDWHHVKARVCVGLMMSLESIRRNPASGGQAAIAGEQQ